ncbi:AIM24 family protein [Methanolobus sp.]|uniref:AIM24 family protein n=1 Tax=Methanolobus sp. TaxID=1874737 RepID=UPI0025EB3BF1|nr:AIM24 family protein [Methanolobus sp.]
MLLFLFGCGIIAETKFYNNITVLDSVDKGNFKAEILQYNSLTGSKNPSLARNLYYIQKAGMSLKQVKITLNDSGVIVEPGALYFQKGNITCDANIGGVGGLAKKMLKNKLTNESAFNPLYKGTGEVFLEPSFSHFLPVTLDNGSIIVDKGIFYCSESTLEVGVASQKNITAGLFGGEGWFQTKISGTGTCILESPVPMGEILKYNLDNERLQVDGNFAILRSDTVKFSVERSGRGIAGKLTSGEGLLQTFEGTGAVWLAPTQQVYHFIAGGSVSSLAAAPYNRNNPA